MDTTSPDVPRAFPEQADSPSVLAAKEVESSPAYACPTLDAHRRVQLAVGGEALLDTEHTPLFLGSLVSRALDAAPIASTSRGRGACCRSSTWSACDPTTPPRP